MASSADSINMALYCDFENVALGVRDANYDKFDITRVLERLLLKGNIVVKKAYCDWDRYKSFKASMHEANFELIEIPHVRQSGKNSADIRLVVDALDLCYTKSHVDTFVIISGDSDFSPLVSKLRENAKQVIGVGVKQSTSDLLIANCDEFIFYDDLVRESQRAAKRDTRDAQSGQKRSPEEEKRRKEELESRRGKGIEIAVETLDALMSERGDSGKIWASMLKEAIKRRKPDFSESAFGFRAFGNLLEEAQARGLLVVGRDEKSGTYVNRSFGTTASEPGSGTESAATPVASGTEGQMDVIAAAEVVGKASPTVGRRGAGGRENGRSRGAGGRKTKAGDETAAATTTATVEASAPTPAVVVPETAAAVPEAAATAIANPSAALAAEPSVPDEKGAAPEVAVAEIDPKGRRAPKSGSGRSGAGGRKAESAGPEQSVAPEQKSAVPEQTKALSEQKKTAPERKKVVTEQKKAAPVASRPAATDPAPAFPGGAEAESAPAAKKPAARRRTRKPAEASGEGG